MATSRSPGPGQYGPVQLIPPGLLSLLQLKNFGKNPEFLSDILQPQLDMLRWYMMQLPETVIAGAASSNLNNATVGFLGVNFAGVTPSGGGQAWTASGAPYWLYVHSCTMSTSLPNAGDRVQFKPAFQPASVGVSYELGETYTSPPIVSTVLTRPAAAAYDFFLPPQTIPGAFFMQSQIGAPGSTNLQCTMRFTRLIP